MKLIKKFTFTPEDIDYSEDVVVYVRFDIHQYGKFTSYKLFRHSLKPGSYYIAGYEVLFLVIDDDIYYIDDNDLPINDTEIIDLIDKVDVNKILDSDLNHLSLITKTILWSYYDG